MKRYVTRQKSLIVFDLEGPEIKIIKQVQAHAFHEISIVQAKKCLPKSSELAKLQPFIDSIGILRVAGRIQKAPVNYESRHPVILPSKHHVARLIIEDHHRLLGHSGMSIRGHHYVKGSG